MHTHVILFDTEYTAWEGSQTRKWSEPWEHREIIQIAALRVDARDGAAEIASFNRLVKPRHNPMLSSYIIELTGISQEAVDARGVAFPAALADFYAFCEQGRLPLFCWGDDPAVLRENCRLNAVDYPAFRAGIYDIRAVFHSAGIDTGRYSSGTVYQAVGMTLAEAAHNALNDVRSLAATLAALRRAGRIGPAWAEETAALPTARFSV